MTEQEKVLDALKCWTNLYVPRERRRDGYCKRKCGYYVGTNSIHCRLIDIVDDVERILNEGTPKVLSVDALRSGITVWAELMNESGDHSLLSSCTLADTFFLDGVIALVTTSSIFIMAANNYGKTWRCWTARPTDAQMETTVWS